MRTNLPVTQREYPFPAGETLVSTTDLQGCILYCNQAFIDLSGYARDELMGQPHNLVRHPDMPAEAFRDLWDTIAAGHPWAALVKNRRKNGDHYWVTANVTPLLDASGKVTGYMSVRTEPDKAAIPGAEALYRQMREEAGSGRASVRLERGQVLSTAPLARLQHRLRPGLRGKMSMTAGLIGVLGFLLGEFEAGGMAHLEGVELLIGTAVVVLCTVAGGWYLKQVAVNPLHSLLAFANQLAGGNLTQTIHSSRSDEIGQLTRALSQLNVNLMSIVRDARNGVMQMRQDTSAIAEGNHNLSSRTESQASSLEETASSMEEITSTIRVSTDMAAQATTHAHRARGVAENSGQAVQALAATMQGISEASRKISEIIQVVDSIAFQTNILALNAAVEAARAGEQGRGFAVVAGEVRALSQRTTVAAREIRGLIQASVQRVDEGGQQTASAMSAMTEAQAAVNEVHQFIEQISHGMREQMLGVTQINQAVAEMDTLTQQNAALVEEIAASATHLSHRAGEVADSVSVFQIKGQTGQHQLADAVSLRKAAKASQAAPAPQHAPQHAAKPAPRTAPSPKPAPVAATPLPVPAASADDGWDTF